MTTDASTKKTIVLVDDDAFLLGMYRAKFISEGYDAVSFLSVKEALAHFRAGGEEPAAVVFDLIMPQDDGFAFLQAMRDEKLVPHAAKIALTNQNSDAEKAHAQDLGADAFLIKATLIPSEVVNTVADIISREHKA